MTIPGFQLCHRALSSAGRCSVAASRAIPRRVCTAKVSRSQRAGSTDSSASHSSRQRARAGSGKTSVFTASRGGSVIDPQVIEALVHARTRLHASAMTGLTSRELDVLREMAQGRGNAGIATELHRSESSVEKHVNAIFIKPGLTTPTISRIAA